MTDDRSAEEASGAGDERSRSGPLARAGRALVPGVVRRNYALQFAVAFLLITLLITGVGALSYVQIQDLTRADAERTLQSTAELQADSVGDWAAGVSADARGGATSNVFRGRDRSQIRGHLTRSLQRASPYVTGFHYVETDEDAVVVSTTRDYEGRSVQSMSESWGAPIQAATTAEEWGVSVADTAYERDGRRLLAFVVPVYDGALVVTAEIPQEHERIDGTRSVVATEVLTPAGDNVFAPNDTGRPHSTESTAFSRAVDGVEGVYEDPANVTAFAPVDGVDWVVMTVAAKADLYEASRTVGRNVIVLVVSSVLALTAVGVVLGSGTVRSLRRLRRRAEAMEAGDLDVDLSTAREDEIGRLFAAFDGMRRALGTQIREAETARERAERSRRDLARQNERLDQFAGTVSHDLRNPLNVASGHLELLERKLDDLGAEATESLASHVETIDDAHVRMESLIEDVLALSRQGEAIDETQPVDLETVARDAWATVDDGGASLSVVGSRTVAADPDRLRQVFENLFRNSVEHGSADPASRAGDSALSVEVGLAETGFYVADGGPGIPPEDADAVFEYGHTTAEDGTGLGLAIVETIVEAHGWRIAVDEGYEAGAKFVVSGLDEE
ncbi:sensor histidine kinase [Halosimplex rubrum]|uniref:sensor histidine kinase n=1 Tax=Halosimplex rubrum TaxID=869889 RepID=UPI001FE27A96|nr:ATP-binding protein [Halosimplex rubrum]